MITYSNEEAEVYTGIVTERQHFGLLQAWMVSNDPLGHAQWLLERFAGGMPVQDVPFTGPSVVLDIGCGTGELLFQAGNKWPHAELLGINKFSKQTFLMGAHAVNICIGDFEELGAGDCAPSADLAMITYTLGHFDHLRSTFRKVRECMIGGGTLGIYDICRRSVLYPSLYGYRLYSKREIIRALEDAGFKDIRWKAVPEAMVTHALEENARAEFEQKTIPFILTAGA